MDGESVKLRNDRYLDKAVQHNSICNLDHSGMVYKSTTPGKHDMPWRFVVIPKGTRTVTDIVFKEDTIGIMQAYYGLDDSWTVGIPLSQNKSRRMYRHLVVCIDSEAVEKFERWD